MREKNNKNSFGVDEKVVCKWYFRKSDIFKIEDEYWCLWMNIFKIEIFFFVKNRARFLVYLF